MTFFLFGDHNNDNLLRLQYNITEKHKSFIIFHVDMKIVLFQT